MTHRCDHPATPENTSPRGRCRTCRNAREQRYRRRLAAGKITYRRQAELPCDRAYRAEMAANNAAFVAALLAALPGGHR